jgi:hypothetical protein
MEKAMVLDCAYQMNSRLLSPALASVMGDGQPPRIICDGLSSREGVNAASNWLPGFAEYYVCGHHQKQPRPSFGGCQSGAVQTCDPST